MNIYNFAQSTLNKIVVFTQSGAQDDIYKSAPSPVILEERSDEESAFVDPQEKQILRYAQDDKKINVVRTFSTIG